MDTPKPGPKPSGAPSLPSAKDIDACARTGHETTVEVLGGLACLCGKEFELQFHVSAIWPPTRE